MRLSQRDKRGRKFYTILCGIWTTFYSILCGIYNETKKEIFAVYFMEFGIYFIVYCATLQRDHRKNVIYIVWHLEYILLYNVRHLQHDHRKNFTTDSVIFTRRSHEIFPVYCAAFTTSLFTVFCVAFCVFWNTFYSILRVIYNERRENLTVYFVAFGNCFTIYCTAFTPRQ